MIFMFECPCRFHTRATYTHSWERPHAASARVFPAQFSPAKGGRAPSLLPASHGFSSRPSKGSGVYFPEKRSQNSSFSHSFSSSPRWPSSRPCGSQREYSPKREPVIHCRPRTGLLLNVLGISLSARPEVGILAGRELESARRGLLCLRSSSSHVLLFLEYRHINILIVSFLWSLNVHEISNRSSCIVLFHSVFFALPHLYLSAFLLSSFSPRSKL